MRLTEIVREAASNLRSGASRAGLLTLVTILCATALLIADAAAIGTLQERARDLRAHAGSVRVLVAEESIDPISCSRLDELQGIASAGAIWLLDPIRVLTLPQLEIPVYQVSEGVAEMLGFSSALSGGVYLPESLAERWGADAGMHIETSNGPVLVHGTYRYPEDDGRDPRLANAVVVVGTSAQPASECWFDVWPVSDSMDSYAYGSLIPSASEDVSPQTAPLNPTTGQRHDFSTEYLSRVTVFTAPAVVLVFAIVAYSGVLRRRIELASNLHAGARRQDLTLGLVLETLIWSFAAATASFAFARLAARVLMNDELVHYEASLGTTLSIAVAAAAVGAAIPALLAREDRLFAIFKGRT